MILAGMEKSGGKISRAGFRSPQNFRVAEKLRQLNVFFSRRHSLHGKNAFRLKRKEGMGYNRASSQQISAVRSTASGLLRPLSIFFWRI
jgi:hypothetical protein